MTDRITIPHNRPPYTLPLARDEFRRALRSGHGRAVQHAERYGIDGLLDDVVEACVRNLAFDQQSEPGRADFMMRLVYAADAEEAVAARLTNAELPDPSDQGQDHDQVHVAELLCDFAELDFGELGDRLRAQYQTLNSWCMESVAEYLIRLDGPTGLVVVASAFGRLLADTDPDAGDRWFLEEAASNIARRFDEDFGSGSTALILEPAARSDESISHFTSAIAAYEAREVASSEQHAAERDRRMRPDPDIEQKIREAIERFRNHRRKHSGTLFQYLGTRAPAEVMEKFCRELATERRPYAIVYTLALFRKRAMPFVDAAHIALLDHPRKRIRTSAYSAMSRSDHPEIRTRALDRLSPAEIMEGSLELFRANYRDGDTPTIMNALFVPDDPEERHSVCWSLLNIFEDTPGRDVLDPMLFVYEHTPCGVCRERAIKILQREGVLPNWVAEEARHDAYSYTFDAFNTDEAPNE